MKIFNIRKILKNKGSMLVEIIVAAAIILLVTTTLITTLIIYMRVSDNNINQIKASFLMEEGMDAIKTLRDSSYSAKIATIPVGTDQYLNFDSYSNSWQVASTPNSVDNIFTRKLIISEVYRNQISRKIVTGNSDPALDVGTKLVTLSVSWLSNGALNTKTLSAYITDLYTN